MASASRYDAIVATFVGILALVVSAYTAHVQRQQVRAQVLPIVTYSTGFSDSEVHLNLYNKGSGPAFIRNATVSVDGKPIHTWPELVKQALGPNPGPHDFHYSAFGHYVLAAGEELDSLTLTATGGKSAGSESATGKKPPKQDNGPAEPMKLAPRDEACSRLASLLQRATISICYCSTLGDCWTLRDVPDQESTTTETRRCPERTEDSFN